MKNDSEKIQLEDTADLLITLLYAPGSTNSVNEPIEGITRFQKLMFLLGQGMGPTQLVEYAKSCGYKPYKMGPYSDKLNNELDTLVSAGIIKTEQLTYWISDDSDESKDEEYDADLGISSSKVVTSYKYSLTKFGETIGKSIWDSIPKSNQQGLSKFKSFFNSLTLRQLLIFAYEKFPEYTTRSIIKEQLGLK